MNRHRRNDRDGRMGRGTLVFLAILSGLTLVVRWWLMGMAYSSENQPLTCCVTRREFVREALVRGEVESASNIDVRCEVRTSEFGWVRILEVVPEGTLVRPGDFLVRLDSSALEAERVRQRIVCEQADALAAKAQAVLETAENAQRTYLESDFRLERDKTEMALFTAREKERHAREMVESGRKLASQGFMTRQEVQADEFSLAAAETELRQGEIKRDVLEQLTKPKTLAKLNSSLVIAKATHSAAEFRRQMSWKRLAEIEQEIEKCTIRAPVAGQVVLNHLYHENHAHMVQPGEQTIQHRVLIRLPDFKHMQLKAKIDEDKIAEVRKGLPARVRLEAYPEVELHGTVKRVAEFPVPDTWMASAIKQYETLISLEDSPVPLRPGLTGQVHIELERIPDVLQVPCQAILKHGDQQYCITVGDGKYTAHAVSVGSDNDLLTVIRKGLEDGQQVVLNPSACRSKVALPDLPLTARR